MAKKGVNDEFYTPAETIINELKYYGYEGCFRNKTIYLPCDYDATLPYIKKEVKRIERIFGVAKWEEEIEIYKVMPELFTDNNIKTIPRNCQFVAYLTEHKEEFGIKDIYISGFDAISKKGLKFQQAPFDLFDIIITNPPFSQMNDWIEKIVDFNAKGGHFIFLAPLSILSNTFAFPYFKNKTFWCGYTEPNYYEDENGIKKKEYLPSVWITNFDVTKNKRKKALTKSWKDHPDEFMPYWNYKAIDVSSVNDIPYDYKGVMGITFTFLKDLHPDQFEIIGLGQGKKQMETLDGLIDREKEGYTTDMIRTQNTGGMYKKNKTTAGVASSKIVLYTTLDMKDPYKCPFCKILFKLKTLDSTIKYYDYDDVIKWLENELKTKKTLDIWHSKLYKTKGNQKIKHGKGRV